MALIGGGAAAKVAEALPMNVERSFNLDSMRPVDEPQHSPDWPDWWNKVRQEEDLRQRRKYIECYDPDLKANRSMSDAAKNIIQRRRDDAARSWFDKMREKAMKDIGL